MTVKTLLPIALNLCLFLVVFGAGSRTATREVLSLFRSPRELICVVIALCVLMPLFVAALVFIFDVNPAVKMALVALSVAPVPTLLPLAAIKKGDTTAYATGVLVAGCLLAIVFVPFAAEVIERIYNVPLEMSATSIASFVFTMILLPLGLGMAVRRYAVAFAHRLGGPIARWAGRGVWACLTVLIIQAAPAMWSLIANGAVLAIIAFVLVGLLIGHVLGGPTYANRMVLAVSTASRHPGVAILIVQANFPDEKLAIPAALLFLLVNILATIIYPMWARRRQVYLSQVRPAV